MSQGPYNLDAGDGGYTLEPQGMPVQNFFQVGWGPVPPFGPAHAFGPGPVPNQPMYADAFPVGARPMDAILPPAECPQACPSEVRADLCVPQGPAAAWDTDEFGDPATFIPPGVRTVPEWTPVGVKNGTGQNTLVGPGGQFVFPTPKLSDAPRGPAVPAGESVGSPGAVSDPARSAAGLFARVPWWGWALGAVALVKVMGK